MALKNSLQASLKLITTHKNFRCFNRLEKNLNGLKLYTEMSRNRQLHTCPLLQKKQEITFILSKNGEEIPVKGKEGDSIYDALIESKINIPGYGACEGTLSCSTCHVKLSPDDFKKISLGPSDEELDMLDLAPDSCDWSRLGCQVILTKELEGLKVEVPSEVKDIREVPRVVNS